MASRIKAIHAYCPRIRLGKRVENDELSELIASRTGLNQSAIQEVLFELHESVIFYNKTGRPVKLEGLGTYAPAIQLDGTITIGHRADSRIINQLNLPGEFRGTIENDQNIGKSSEGLVAIWNAEHPEDPVTQEYPIKMPAVSLFGIQVSSKGKSVSYQEVGLFLVRNRSIHSMNWIIS